MKTVLDRTFAIEKDVKDTKFYLLSAGAATTEDYMKLMIESFRSYIGCFRAGGNEIEDVAHRSDLAGGEAVDLFVVQN